MVQWVRRERRSSASPSDAHREIELPEDWSTGAAEALLRQGGANLASVREWVHEVGTAFEARGRGRDVLIAAEDITEWKEQLEGLLLTQSALVCLPDVWRGEKREGGRLPAQACAGIRLTRFLQPDGKLDCDALRQAIRLVLLLLLLLEDRSVGSAPVGVPMGPQVSLLDMAALLVASGVPYDSDTARALSVAVSALVSADLTLHGQSWLRLSGDGGVAGSAVQLVASEAQLRVSELERLLPGVAEARIVPIRREASASAYEVDETPLVRQLPELLQLARSGWSEIARRAQQQEMGTLVLVVRSRAWMVEALDCDCDELTPLSALIDEERRGGRGESRLQRRAKRVVGAGLDRLAYTAPERDAILRELESSGDMSSTGLKARHRRVFAVRGGEKEAPGAGGAGRSAVAGLGPRGEERMRVALRLFADFSEPSGLRDPTRASGRPDLREEGGGEVGATDSPLHRDHAALLGVRVSEELTTEQPPPSQRLVNWGEKSASGGQQRGWEEQEDRGAVGWNSLTDEVERAQGRGALKESERGPGTSARATQMEQMPAERQALTHSFRIDGREGTLTVGLFHDGRLGEVYLRMPRESSAVKGLLDAFSTATSVALQHGVTLRELTSHFAGLHFEPSGETANPEIPTARSPMDYLFRWLEVRFAPLLSSP